MVEELKTLQEIGWKIIVWTVRHNVKDVKKWLKSYNIPHDYVNENPWGPAGDKSRKMYADVYLDDRATETQLDWRQRSIVLRYGTRRIL